jgi:hypothetical protein
MILLVEKKFRDMEPLHEVWVSVEKHFIGLVKIDGQWALVYSPSLERVPFNLMIEAPLEVRLSLPKCLTILHQAILESRQDLSQRVEKAIQELESYFNNFWPIL